MKLGLLVAVLVACGGSAPAPITTLPSDPQLQKGTHRVQVDGIELAYEVRGTGPLCIAHPGGPGADSAYLRSDALERQFTMIYIDPAGTGSSGKLPAGETYSMTRDARILEALRDKLGLDRMCLVGHSYGGMVVLRYAVEHPRRVSGLFLYSTSPTTGEDWEKATAEGLQMFASQPWFKSAAAALERETKAKSQAELDAAVKDELPLYFADWSGHRAAYEPLVAAFKISYDVLRGQRDSEPFDVRHRLGVIHTTPTVIVSGRRDFLCGTKPATWLAQAIGGSKLVEIEQAGHFAHVEQPAEFARAVDLFASMLR
ncbi:MAG TPA: alpha/beta hydrolase [Kofleriaceae bacterium]|nr:alpha/beta hydrolase [Kofleriaceae bacterium]